MSFCIFEAKRDTITDGTHKLRSAVSKLFNRSHAKTSRKSQIDNYENATGKDGKTAKAVIDELYQPNHLGFFNGIPADEITIPLALVVITSLIMLTLSVFFSINAYMDGKSFAKGKTRYYITEDKSHVAIPVSENMYAILDAVINGSTITIHTKKQEFHEYNELVELQRFEEVVITDVDGEVIK